jgi:hypothetical protein
MSSRSIVQLVLALALCGIWGCASDGDKTPPSGVISNQVVSATARVEALDLATRRIVLRRSDGQVLRFRVADEVRNLPQVRVGDEVKVAFHESLAWDVKKPGEATAGAAVTDSMNRAEPGARPAGVIERSLKVTSTIDKIDKSAQTVTLRSASGELSTIKVRDPKNLDRVSVGDLVEITYTEGLALSIEPPAR